MTAALDTATAAFGNRNVQAFMHVIGLGETSENLSDRDFRLVHRDSSLITDPMRHPFYGVPCPPGTPTTACGFGGFLGTTWKDCDEALGFGGDFSPPNQLIASVWLIDVRRHALAEVQRGDLAAALAKLRDEWDSFRRMELSSAVDVFTHHGGVLTTVSPEVVGDGTPPPSPSVPSAPPGAPSVMRPERLVDVLGENLDAIVGEYKAIGAQVTWTQQTNGLWTIEATFKGKA